MLIFFFYLLIAVSCDLGRAPTAEDVAAFMNDNPPIRNYTDLDVDDLDPEEPAIAESERQLDEIADYQEKQLRSTSRRALIDEKMRIELKDRADAQERIRIALEYHQQCQHHEWACKHQCRIDTKDSSKECLESDVFNEYQCFGIPINYAFSGDFNQRIPHEYAILSRFPRCWKFVGPLMCSVLFRPCARHIYYTKVKMSVKNGTMIAYQLLRRANCRRARDECSDAVAMGVYPDFLNCDDGHIPPVMFPKNNSRRIFTDECSMRSPPPLTVPDGECAWPLVKADRDNVEDAVPLFDDCFMPCRSPLIAPSYFNSFNVTRATFGSMLTIFFLFAFFYITFFSYIYTKSLIVYCISQSFLCIGLYCLLWTLPIVSTVADAVDCTRNGLIRKSTTIYQAFDWCDVNTLLVHFTHISGILWLLSHFFFSYAQPSKMARHELSDAKTRFSLSSIVYGSAAIAAIVMLWTNTRENDGIAGLCQVGLLSFWPFFFTYSGLLIVTIAMIIYGFLMKEEQEQKLMDSSMIRPKTMLARLQAEALELRKEILRSIGILEPSDDDIAAVSASQEEDCLLEKPVEKSTRSSHTTGPGFSIPISTRDLLINPMAPSLIPGRQKRLDYWLGKLQKKMQPDPELNCTSSDARLRVYAEIMCYLEAPMRGRWKESVNFKWSLTAMSLLIAVLVLSIPLHYFYVSMESHVERELVMDHISCGIRHAVRNQSIEWTQPDTDYWNGTTYDYISTPFLRSSGRDASWCALKSGKAVARLNTMLAVFLLFPALPYLVLLVAFVIGFWAKVGMIEIRRIRQNPFNLCECPFVSTGVDDVEMNMIESTPETHLLQEEGDPNTASASSVTWSKASIGRFPSWEAVKNERTSPVPNDTTSDKIIRQTSIGSKIRKIDMWQRRKEHKAQTRQQLAVNDVLELQEYALAQASTNLSSQSTIPDITNTATTSSANTISNMNSTQALASVPVPVVDTNDVTQSNLIFVTRLLSESSNREGQLRERLRSFLEQTKILHHELTLHKTRMDTELQAWTLLNEHLPMINSLYIQLVASIDSDQMVFLDKRIAGALLHELLEEMRMLEPLKDSAPGLQRSLRASMGSMEMAQMTLQHIFGVQPEAMVNRSMDPAVLESELVRNNQLRGMVQQSQTRRMNLDMEGRRMEYLQWPMQQQQQQQQQAFPSFSAASPFAMFAQDQRQQQAPPEQPQPPAQQQVQAPMSFADFRFGQPIPQQVPPQSQQSQPPTQQQPYVPHYPQSAASSCSSVPSSIIPVSIPSAVFQPGSSSQQGSSTGLAGTAAAPQPPVAVPMVINGVRVVQEEVRTGQGRARPAGANDDNNNSQEDANYPNVRLMIPAQRLFGPPPIAGEGMRAEESASESEDGEGVQQAQEDEEEAAPERAMLSAHTDNYSAARRGVYTRLTADQLAQRVQLIRQMVNHEMYPQEVTHILVLIGDVYFSRGSLRMGSAAPERLIRPPQLIPILGDGPDIDPIVPPTQFQQAMRRRAIILVASVGFHFHSVGEPERHVDYSVPILPIERNFQNALLIDEIVFARILGSPDGPAAVQDLLAQFNYGIDQLYYRYQIRVVRWFNEYLDFASVREGIQPLPRDEYVSDPEPTDSSDVGFLEPFGPGPHARDAVVHGAEGLQEEMREFLDRRINREDAAEGGNEGENQAEAEEGQQEADHHLAAVEVVNEQNGDLRR